MSIQLYNLIIVTNISFYRNLSTLQMSCFLNLNVVSMTCNSDFCCYYNGLGDGGGGRGREGEGGGVEGAKWKIPVHSSLRSFFFKVKTITNKVYKRRLILHFNKMVVYCLFIKHKVHFLNNKIKKFCSLCQNNMIHL